MAKSALIHNSVYAGSCIILPTKHAKSIAIGPAFENKIQAGILEYVIDTDTLGTFSGEIERKGSALECARRKCEWALETLGDKVDFVLASEGSFAPHPVYHFLPCDHEILYFIDKKRNFHLHLSLLSEKTNYRMGAVDSLETLYQFAQAALFPSHALILRPNNRNNVSTLFKGICSNADLEEAFKQCLKHSTNGEVWVETDMRAHVNPSRMTVISELATKLAERLATHCKRCDTPGWGKIRHEKGLICSDCGLETDLIKKEIWGCVKCDYEEINDRADGLKYADPSGCIYCNP